MREASPSSKTLSKASLHSHRIGEIERQLFLSQFERQAGDQLMPCLRQSVAAKGSILFMARLNTEGRLTAIRVLDAQANGASCVRSALEGMIFLESAKGLTRDSVELSWRMDW